MAWNFYGAASAKVERIHLSVMSTASSVLNHIIGR